MTNFSSSARTICPFYIKEAKKSITCEGITDSVTSVTRFGSYEEKRSYQHQNCERNDYAACCELAAALCRKYEERST